MGKYERVVWQDGDFHSIEPYAPIAPDHRPQDLRRDGSGLTFETLDHGGSEPDLMPQAIRVTDGEGRSCIYVPARIDEEAHDSDYVELDAGDTWLGG